jgi:glutamate/tyrosine decarboxylase-like PLP-dependent enzyme
MANAAALTAARDQQLARAGWDVQADGLFGAPELTVVVGEKAHSTLIKALGLVGLGRERVHRSRLQIDGDVLRWTASMNVTLRKVA